MISPPNLKSDQSNGLDWAHIIYAELFYNGKATLSFTHIASLSNLLQVTCNYITDSIADVFIFTKHVTTYTRWCYLEYIVNYIHINNSKTAFYWTMRSILMLIPWWIDVNNGIKFHIKVQNIAMTISILQLCTQYLYTLAHGWGTWD